jgi:hypothetical protein
MPQLAGQILLTPMLDPAQTSGSMRLARDCPCRAGWAEYLPFVSDAMHPYVAPMHSKRLGRLPPALIITAEFDPLRDGAEEYAVRLIGAGIAVRVRRMEQAETFHAWTDGRLWMYDHNGAIKWEKVIAVMRYASEKFGITQFVVDSLMKCVRGETDYDTQKDFVNELCAFAQSRKVHIHLVHHVRKGENEDQIPGKFDAKGAGAITDSRPYRGVGDAAERDCIAFKAECRRPLFQGGAGDDGRLPVDEVIRTSGRFCGAGCVQDGKDNPDREGVQLGKFH